MKRLGILIAVIAGSALALAAPASAQVSPSQTGYTPVSPPVQDTLSGGGQGGEAAGQGAAGAQVGDGREVAGQAQGAEVAAAAQDSAQGGNGGKLPFTGIDLALIAGAGAMLFLLGIGMRRLARAGAPA